ncbi:uncharacterized protein V6R79_012589 [Siganus canaliculatus]
MAKWKLSFLLFVSLCFTSEEVLLKTSRNKEDVVEICTNATLGFTMIICKIRTQRSRGEECRLLYRHGQELKHECGSRFMLWIKKQTAFLYMTGLTPVDSGNFTCECVHPDGTDTVTLNITVETYEAQSNSGSAETSSVTLVVAGGVAAFVTFAAGIGFILRMKCCRKRAVKDASGLSVGESHCDVEKTGDIYVNLQQSANDVYQNFPKNGALR